MEKKVFSKGGGTYPGGVILSVTSKDAAMTGGGETIS